MFLARAVEDLHDTHFDITEETEVEIVVSAFYLLDLWRAR